MDIITYALCKKQIQSALAGEGISAGKSAFEIAKDNGFTGTVDEWLDSLKGQSPYIGENGNWFVGDTDTGVIAVGEKTNGINIEKIRELFEEE